MRITRLGSDSSRSGTRPSYLTLSYAWGETNEDGSHLSECIDCNERSVFVTVTLLQALKRIRKRLQDHEFDLDMPGDTEMKSRPGIWIDAISIDQQNQDEKCEQVARMADIYCYSKQLLIWLGEGPVGHAGKEQRRLFEYVSTSSYLDFSRPFLEEKDLPAMVDLLHARWFGRRWVIQEYALTTSSCSAFILGENICPAESLYAAVRRLRLLHSCGALRNRSARFGLLTDLRRQPLISLLHMHSDSQCTVSHDRVYALMHMARGTKLCVDYKRPIANLYLEVARSTLEEWVSRADVVHALLALATVYNLRPVSDAGPVEERSPAISLLKSDKQTARKKARGEARKQASSQVPPAGSSSVSPSSTVDRLPSWIPIWEAQAVYTSPQHDSAVRIAVERTTKPTHGPTPWLSQPRPLQVRDDLALIIQGVIITPCDKLENWKSKGDYSWKWRAWQASACRCLCCRVICDIQYRARGIQPALKSIIEAERRGCTLLIMSACILRPDGVWLAFVASKASDAYNPSQAPGFRLEYCLCIDKGGEDQDHKSLQNVLSEDLTDICIV